MTDRFPELPRIEVEADVAERALMPDDLDANVVGPYSVPDTRRRRRAGYVYLVGAAVVAAGAGAGWLPGPVLAVAVMLALISGYHILTGAPLAVREGAALLAANRATDFPVGHASATLNFEGALARPVWNVLVFSADDPPTRRGLVRVDGRSGDVVERYTEPVPADGV